MGRWIRSHLRGGEGAAEAQPAPRGCRYCAGTHIGEHADLRCSPRSSPVVKIDDDTWVINASMLMLTVASSLRPRSSDGAHQRGVWGKCYELTLRKTSRRRAWCWSPPWVVLLSALKY